MSTGHTCGARREEDGHRPASSLLSAALVALQIFSTEAANASFPTTYPPWGAALLHPTTQTPVQFELPILAPLTVNACGPSRYMSMRIAVSHVNLRDATLCPAIATLNNTFEMAYEMLDDHSNGVGAVTGAIELQNRWQAKGKTIKVVGGPNGSDASIAASTYLMIFGIPLMSWAATSTQLSNKAIYPNFFRISSPDSLVMYVLAEFVFYLGFVQATAVYFDAQYQTGQRDTFCSAAALRGIQVSSVKLPSSGAGGVAVSESNWPGMVRGLEAVREGPCRVVFAAAVSVEAYNLWTAAYDLGMITSSGWLWLGADGIAGGNVAGDKQRTIVFAGSIYLIAQPSTDRFNIFMDRWQELMPFTDIPEFFSEERCFDTPGKPYVTCSGRSDFIGWTPKHASQLQCTDAYTGLAYDAVVTLAVVLDRLLTRGHSALENITATDFLTELRMLSDPSKAFTCLTGDISLDADQERLLPVAFHVWKRGLTTAPEIGTWSKLSGIRWQVGETMVWPSGANATIVDASALPLVPSGAAPSCPTGFKLNLTMDSCVQAVPACPSGTAYNASAAACTLCGPGFYADNGPRTLNPSECTACPAGRVAVAAGSASCAPCAAGSAAAPGSSACALCPAGRQGVQAGAPCSPCPRGAFTDLPGSIDCLQCPSGTEASSEGSTACSACLPGRARSALGPAVECQLCGRGTYSLGNSSDCSICQSGQFQDSVARTACATCTAPLTTVATGAKSEVDCVCPEGTYLPSGGAASNGSEQLPGCQRCPEKMACPVGSRQDEMPEYNPEALGPYPAVEPGFMTLRGDGFKVFKCLSERACPGGPTAACGELRDDRSVACGRCIDGAFEKDSACHQCGNNGLWLLAIAAVLAVILVGILTIMVNKDMFMVSASTLMMMILTGLMLSCVQTLGIFASLSIQWFEPVDTILQLVKLLSFDLKVLKVQCAASHALVAEYVLRQCIAPLGMPVILATLIAKKRLWNQETNIGLEFTNSVGTIFNVVFISILFSAFHPFVCYPHPCRLASMRSMPSVLCFAGDANHTGMVLAGLLAFLTVPVPFASAVTVATWKYPTWISGTGASSQYAHRAFRFLFIRFKPKRYYYGVPLLIRSFLLCLVPVALSNDVALQVSLASAIICIFMLVQQQLNPWARPSTNVIDGALSGALLLMLLTGSLAAGVSASSASTQALGIAAFSVLTALAVGVMLYTAYQRIRRTDVYSYFICHHKAQAAAQARLLKILLQAKGHRKTVFIDSDDLLELTELFDIVKCKVQHLIVYLTRDVLTRPWCAGEVVTAFQARIQVTAVKAPSFRGVTQEQLANPGAYLDWTSCNLVMYGITLAQVEEAYAWLFAQGVPVFPGPELRGSRFFEGVVCRLIGHSTSEEDDSNLDSIPAHDGALVISSDPSDDEAAASFNILLSKIKEDVFIFMNDGITCLADHAEDLHMVGMACAAARAVIVILSGGSTSSVAQLTAIVSSLQSFEASLESHTPARVVHTMDVLGLPKVIPVNLPCFVFPHADYYEEAFPNLWQGSNVAEAAQRVRAFFMRISVRLTVSASDKVLAVQAKEVLDRIPRSYRLGLRRSGAQWMPQTEDSGLEDVSSEDEEIRRV